MKKSQLIKRLIKRTIVVYGVSLLVLLMALLTVDYISLEQKYEKDLNNDIKSVERIITQFYLAGDFVGLKSYLETWTEIHKLDATFHDSGGALIWQSKRHEGSKSLVSKKHNIRYGDFSDIGSLFVSKNIQLLKYERMYVYLQVIIFSSALCLLFIIIFYFIIERTLRPLSEVRKELIAEAEKMGFSLSSSGINEIYDIKKWFNEISDAWLLEKDAARKSAQMAALASVAAQVSHDIRSPLSALNLILWQLNQIPEEHRIIIRSAVQRINDIANSLLQKSKQQLLSLSGGTVGDEKNDLTCELVPALIDSMLSEKRVQVREKIDIEISQDLKEGYGLFALIDPGNFKRVLSNLINNSIDAFQNDEGLVQVSLKEKDGQIIINIRDNGKGIDSEMLKSLGERRISSGKDQTSSGTGLGVYHAKRVIESFKGNLSFSSDLDLGTLVTIMIPKSTPPDWFVRKLILEKGGQVVSLDDDKLVHEIWRQRLNSEDFPSGDFSFTCFTSADEFVAWNLDNEKRSLEASKTLFLIDYELVGDSKTGLDLIEELNIEDRSILVTSRYEESQIRERCEKMKLRILPKSLAGLVPIEFMSPSLYPSDSKVRKMSI